jgi:beta-glucosidase
VAQALAPDLDLSREPRWGRVEETYGEDPYLVSRMGVAYIRAMQGPGPDVTGDHLVCTPKHYAAHGSPEGGLNISPVPGGLRDLYMTYLPPFKAAVVEAGALSIMPAYSEYDGVPASKSALLLTRVLREEWGFPGYVFSDYGAIYMLVRTHRTALDAADAGRQALEAGMDVEAPSEWAFGEQLLDLVRKGEVSVDLVDRAVARVLRVKFLAGLFENPYADPERAVRIVNCDEHKALARRIAQESITLLTNGRGLLPLDPSIASLAVIGPNADAAQCGDYSQFKPEAITPFQGIRAAVSQETAVRYAKGCGLFERSREGFHEAVEAARRSDTAVVVIGGSSSVMGGVGWGSQGGVATCGEGFDRAELTPPGVQEDLVRAVIETGTPTVVVLMNGRPYGIEWIAGNAAAVVEAWYPGEQGGHALADVLFGKVNPSGRLPISFPRSVGHVPSYYNHKPSARGYYRKPGTPDAPGRDYVFSTPAPLFPFGHGLSYTTFKYSRLGVTPRRILPGGRVQVEVEVRNTGKRAGKEVVQLYVTDVVSSVTTPVRSLRRFAKVHIEPGEQKTVFFELTPDDLKLLDERMNWVVEPGRFEVAVGPLKKVFDVVVPR